MRCCHLSEPVITVSCIDDLEFASFQSLTETKFYLLYIFVRRRTVDREDISTVRACLDQSLSHQGSYHLIVDRDIEVCIHICDHPVIADYFDPLVLRFFYHIIQSISVDRDDHDHVHFLLDKVFDL